MRPIVIVNAKTYPQATGPGAIRLAKECEAAARTHKADVRIAVQPTDIAAVAAAVAIPVYAQHVDAADAGRHTGSISALALKRAGATGCLLNHSERRLHTKEVVAAARLLRKHKLAAIVCAESIARLRELAAAVKPDCFCVEPPELIGGDASVSVARPSVVTHAVHASPVPLLVGAGVREHADLAIALELGAAGVLLASGIALASNRERAFRKLLTAR